MDEPFLWIVGGGVAGIAVVAWLVSRRWERQRTEALQRLCMMLGFSFSAEDPGLEHEAWRRLPLFQRGRSRRCKNVMRGTIRGLEAIVFGYQYTTGGGQSSTTHRQTVAAFRLSGRALPQFSMSPESLFHRLGQMLGVRDIDFESHPDFSKRYVLKGKDEAAIRALFHPGLVQRFSQGTPWSLEGGGEWLVTYRPRKRVRTDELQRFMEEAAELASLFAAA